MKGRTFLRGNKSLQRLSVGIRSRREARSLGIGLALMLSACGTALPPPDEPGRHLPNAAPAAPGASDIPQVVTPLPMVEPPRPEEEVEFYTASVLDRPVQE